MVSKLVEGYQNQYLKERARMWEDNEEAIIDEDGFKEKQKIRNVLVQ